MGLVAITRSVSPAITRCLVTHIDRQRIDVDHAIMQHDLYVDILRELGCEVIELGPSPLAPDSVFVEDTAVVLDELAILTRPGAESRRAEVAPMARVLSSYRTLGQIKGPGTLDGGDVLCIGKKVWVGVSDRSNEEGRGQLRKLVESRDYEMIEVPFQGCLHLKSAVTAISDGAVVLNPEWVDAEDFSGLEVVEVDPSEPRAGNVLQIHDTVLVPLRVPKTADRIRAHGLNVRIVEMSELAKAEGGLTCCSILIDGRDF